VGYLAITGLTFRAGLCLRIPYSIAPQDDQHHETQLDQHAETAREVIFGCFWTMHVFYRVSNIMGSFRLLTSCSPVSFKRDNVII